MNRPGPKTTVIGAHLRLLMNVDGTIDSVAELMELKKAVETIQASLPEDVRLFVDNVNIGHDESMR
jgi:hypothetical protein